MSDGGAGHFLDEIRATFASRSEKPALVFADGSYTFAELESKAERAAAWLNGLWWPGPGDRVVIASAEKRPFLAAHLGALFAGAVALPVNPRFTRGRDAARRLADSGSPWRSSAPRGRASDRLDPRRAARARAVVSDAEAWDAPAARFQCAQTSGPIRPP